MLSLHHHTLTLPARMITVSTLARDGSLVGLLLDLDRETAKRRFAARGFSLAEISPEPLPRFVDELERYASGEPVVWETPIAFEGGTPFQRKIWSAIAQIPPGTSMTYGELAAAVGKPGGARAAGGACGRNPIPLRVPCHRILASDGSIGGFTGVLETKRALLGHEGVAPFAAPTLFDRDEGSAKERR